MAITTTKTKSDIGQGGGNIAYIREVQESGADLGSPDTNHSIGHIRKTNISDVTEMNKHFAENGALVASLTGKRTIGVKFELMQRSKAYIDALVEEVRGKYYRLYYQTSANQGGKVAEFVFGICQIQPKVELSYTDGDLTILPCDVDVLKNETSITVANLDLPSEKKTASAMDIAAGKYWSRAET